MTGDACLELTITERVDPEAAEELARSLRGLIEVAGPSIYCRKAGGELPQFVQLLGSLPSWMLLGAPAAAVVATRLGTRIVDDAYDALKKRIVSRPIDTASAAFSTLLARLPPKSEVLIGFDIPDERWGSVVRLNSKSDVAQQLAWFVEQGPLIHAAVSAACDRNEGPMTGATIEVQANGAVRITWVADDLKQRIEVLPPPETTAVRFKRGWVQHSANLS